MIVCRKVKETDEFVPSDCEAFIIDHERIVNSSSGYNSIFLSCNIQKEGFSESTNKVADAVYDIRVIDVEGILTEPPSLNIGELYVELTKVNDEYRLEGVTFDSPLFLSPIVWDGECLLVNLDSSRYKSGVTVTWSSVYIGDCPQRRQLASINGVVNYGKYNVKYGEGYGILYETGVDGKKAQTLKFTIKSDSVPPSKSLIASRLLSMSTTF